MTSDTLTVALVSEVFFDRDGPQRLRRRLAEARQQGAELAVLPELPLNPWSPESRTPRPQDAEPPDGPRGRTLAAAAAEADIAVLGGAIVQEAPDRPRRNTALLVDATGRLVTSYAKMHLPQEPGFWETSHYEAGNEAATAVTLPASGLSLGIQICSDINRPQCSHALAAAGAEAILLPRATQGATWDRWRVVFRAVALTSSVYVVSVNRPTSQQRDGVLIGGPSVAVAPSGDVLLETTEPLAVTTLDRAEIRRARTSYPGYLPVRSRLYASAWAAVADSARS